jgi:hypothetical protein
MSDKATIRVFRRANFFGYLHNFNLFVNDEKIATIGNAQESVFDVPAGKHRLFVQFGFGGKTKPIDVNLAPGELKSLECSVNKTPLLLLPLAYCGLLICNYTGAKITFIGLILASIFLLLWAITLFDSYYKAYMNYFFLREVS